MDCTMNAPGVTGLEDDSALGMPDAAPTIANMLKDMAKRTPKEFRSKVRK